MPVMTPVPEGYTREQYGNAVMDAFGPGSMPVAGMTKAQTGPILRDIFERLLAKFKSQKTITGQLSLSDLTDTLSAVGETSKGLLKARQYGILEHPVFQPESGFGFFGNLLDPPPTWLGKYHPQNPGISLASTPSERLVGGGKRIWTREADVVPTLAHEGGHHLTYGVSSPGATMEWAKPIYEDIDRMVNPYERAITKARHTGFTVKEPGGSPYKIDWAIRPEEMMANSLSLEASKRLGIKPQPFDLWSGSILPEESLSRPEFKKLVDTLLFGTGK